MKNSISGLLGDKKIEWAHANVGLDQLKNAAIVQQYGCNHWSRLFEYPWMIKYSILKAEDWVLDAGGGNSPLQDILVQVGCRVVNIDLDVQSAINHPNCLCLKGNLENLEFVPDDTFQTVFCVSVLEHTKDPIKAIAELWRVLRPGGRLLVSIDVAPYLRWNHNIDIQKAAALVSTLGFTLPIEPSDILQQSFPEIDPKEDEPIEIILKVLCFYRDKKI